MKLNQERLKRKAALNFALMKLAKSIAAEYNITEFFSGIESAKDKGTRLFTNDQIGPFVIKK